MTDPFPADAGGGLPDGTGEEHDQGAGARGELPQAVSLGARARGWIEAEVEEWMRERIAESRGDAEAVAY